MGSGGNDRVEITDEREQAAGWRFRVRVTSGAASEDRTLTLSWADYNHWSPDGADPPHAVARAVARFLVERMAAADMPPTLDASWARRRFEDADTRIPDLIDR